MSPVASKILATINAPYNAGVSAWELASVSPVLTQ